MKKPRRQTKLQKLIQQFTPELEEAQKRVKDLKGRDSLALRRAQKSKSKSRGKHGKIFSFSDIKSQKQLYREIVRIRSFLSEPTSKAENTSKKKPFWSNYNKEKTGRTSDAYSLYRRLVERFGGEERFRAIIQANSTSKNKYESDTILDDIDFDLSMGMSEEEVIEKYESIIKNMEDVYKGLKSNME